MANHQVSSPESAPVRRVPQRGVPPARQTAARACCTPADRSGTARARVAAGVAGTCGSLACIASMVLPLVGLAGAGAAAGGSMAGMGPAPSAASGAATTASSHPDGLLGVLVAIGPELLVVSILLVTASLALRRRVAIAPAFVGGAILYWGMYAQSSDAVMYATMAAGYLIWVATYAWTRIGPRPRPSVRAYAG